MAIAQGHGEGSSFIHYGTPSNRGGQSLLDLMLAADSNPGLSPDQVRQLDALADNGPARVD
jgi:hypothetical protein